MKLKNRLFAFITAALLILGTAAFTGCSPATTGGSGAGNGIQAPAEPSAVINLTARGGDGKVKLSWTNPVVESFKSVKIFQGESTAPLCELTEKETSYEVTGLTNGTEYTFKVVSYFLIEGETKYFQAIVKATPKNVPALSSVQFAENLVIGWNLGNTLDANGYWNGVYNEGKKLEVNWLPIGKKDYTTEAMIKAVHAAGFETIRIPVSWHNHMAQYTSDYKIDSAWMARVKEVVDWAINDGMYVIINIHHDNNTEEQMASHPGFAISTDSKIQTKSKAFIEKVWEQIATTFASYDQHLIFEILNEPRCIGTNFEWGFYSSANASKAKTYCDIITSYEQVALNKIRSVAGNENRFVMVPGYAASGTDQVALKAFTLPVDSATDKLLLSTHAYSPNDFALSNDLTKTEYKSSYDSDLQSIFAFLKSNYVDKGIGVVMGEASATDKNNTAERIKWAASYFGKAKAASIPVVLWDNYVTWGEGEDASERHGHFKRSDCTWYHPDFIAAMVQAAGGAAGGTGDGAAGGTGDGAAGGTGGGTTSGGGTAGGSSGGSFTPVTLFDPETATAPAGTEIVTVGSKKYLKVSIDGYNTSFEIPEVNCKGATTFKVECFAENLPTGVQVVVGIKDASTSDWKDVSTLTYSPSETLITGSPASGEKASTTMKATKIQPMAMETTSGSYLGTDGIVFYIGKITCE